MANCYEASYHNNICEIIRILEERSAEVAEVVDNVLG